MITLKFFRPGRSKLYKKWHGGRRFALLGCGLIVDWRHERGAVLEPMRLPAPAVPSTVATFGRRLEAHAKGIRELDRRNAYAAPLPLMTDASDVMPHASADEHISSGTVEHAAARE